jgi:hypothetical protein
MRVMGIEALGRNGGMEKRELAWIAIEVLGEDFPVLPGRTGRRCYGEAPLLGPASLPVTGDKLDGMLLWPRLYLPWPYRGGR